MRITGLIASHSQCASLRMLDFEAFCAFYALCVSLCLLCTSFHGRWSLSWKLYARACVWSMSIVRFIKLGVFEPEAIAAMGEAFDAACKELHDTGQPEVVLEVIANR